MLTWTVSDCLASPSFPNLNNKYTQTYSDAMMYLCCVTVALVNSTLKRMQCLHPTCSTLTGHTNSTASLQMQCFPCKSTLVKTKYIIFALRNPAAQVATWHQEPTWTTKTWLTCGIMLAIQKLADFRPFRFQIFGYGMLTTDTYVTLFPDWLYSQAVSWFSDCCSILSLGNFLPFRIMVCRIFCLNVFVSWAAMLLLLPVLL